SHKIGQAIQRLQNENTAFTYRNIFTRSAAVANYNGVVDDATTAVLDPANTALITEAANDFISVTIPYKDSELSLLLYKVQIATDDLTVDTDKMKNISFEKGVHYRGIISGDYTSVVSMNFFKNEMSGIVSSYGL